MSTPSQARLQQLFTFDPATGELRWKRRKGVAAGSVAGCVSKDGYRRICVDGVDYLAHRLVWAFVRGTPVPPFIDHRNTRKDDNRPRNLRAATKSQNGMNRPKQRDNSTGFKGVCWDKAKSKYAATIKRNGKQYNLGRFDDPATAHAAYVRAAAELHGEFARTGP